MSGLLFSSLFETNRNRFKEINELTKELSARYWRSGIIGENIINIISAFAEKQSIALEILCYPFSDDELWAFTLQKKGTIFVCINSELPISKQIFAAAHELYHIYRYAVDIDKEGSGIATLLDSKTADECAQNQEDAEANAFAALILLPDALLAEHLSIFDIPKNAPSLDDILVLMDSFGIPFKAVVLRLYESQWISKVKAEELLATTAEIVEKRSSLTGKARRWLICDRGVKRFGSLPINITFNAEHDFLTTSRAKEDMEFVEMLMNKIENK